MARELRLRARDVVVRVDDGSGEITAFRIWMDRGRRNWGVELVLIGGVVGEFGRW